MGQAITRRGDTSGPRANALEAGRLPPQAPELERAVLGALMLERDAVREALGVLDTGSFYVDAHRRIYAVILDLYREGMPVDLLTVTEGLKRRGDLELVGGAYYVSQLTIGIASSANLAYHARIVSQKHILRELIQVSADISREAYDDGTDVFDLLASASERLRAIDRKLAGGRETATAAEDVGALADSSPLPAGYSTGIAPLDEVVQLQPGLPYVFAARPGIGKSMVACHMAWSMTQHGDVLLFSPEMTLRQVQARIISMECGVPYSVILGRRMDQQQCDIVARCSMDLAGRLARLHVDETSGLTPQRLLRVASAAKQDHGIKGFIVDHLHKMSTGNPRVDAEETPRVSQCMEGITRVAKDEQLFAVVFAQLNRQVEGRMDRRPRLADLKQTGRIEEDAAAVVLLYREGYYSVEKPYEEDLEMMVAKNRDGATDLVAVRCVPALSRLGPP